MNPETLALLTGLYGTENNPAPSGLSNVPQDTDAASFAGGLDLGVNPSKKQRSAATNALLAVADIFNISASRPNLFGQSAIQPGSAYLGQSEERANALQKVRMEQDPEGRQIDLNRAKVLSQKAYQEKDPVKKAIYGREIKKLLPNETQGLDDITAADMFTSNEKIELERLKQTGRIQLQQLKNSGNLDVATLKASSAEEINRAKLDTQWDIATLNNEYRQAIADGNNERAITVAQMITDRQTDLAMLNNAAKLKQTEMQQTGANYRTMLQQEGQTTRTMAQNASREEIARMQADTAREQIAGRQKVAEINAEAKKAAAESKAGQSAGQAANLEAKTSPELLAKMKKLNTSAGRWDYLGDPEGMNIWQRTVPGSTYAVSVQNAEQTAKDYQEFEGLAKQIVQDQLRKIYGPQFTQKEGEAFFESMGLSPKMAPEVRWTLFMNAINNVRRNAGLAPIDNGTNLSPVKSGSTSKIKSVKRIG